MVLLSFVCCCPFGLILFYCDMTGNNGIGRFKPEFSALTPTAESYIVRALSSAQVEHERVQQAAALGLQLSAPHGHMLSMLPPSALSSSSPSSIAMSNSLSQLMNDDELLRRQHLRSYRKRHPHVHHTSANDAHTHHHNITPPASSVAASGGHDQSINNLSGHIIPRQIKSSQMNRHHLGGIGGFGGGVDRRPATAAGGRVLTELEKEEKHMKLPSNLPNGVMISRMRKELPTK
jgi:hypothetical protein